MQSSCERSVHDDALRRSAQEYLKLHRARLTLEVKSGKSGLAVVAEHSRVMDGLLTTLWCAAMATQRTSPADGVVLLALGGYGRRTLGLQSDLDLLFLCEASLPDSTVIEFAEKVLYPLWDLGISVGHAVRTVDDTLSLCREDLRTATTLLDARVVIGNRALHEDLIRRAGQLGSDAFVKALDAENTERHERFGGSVYLLEPEVKSGAGGLRDVDSIGWLAGARWGARSSADAVLTGAFSEREATELGEAHEFFWRVRNLLHLRAGRRQDRLTFEDQEELAVELGYRDEIVIAVEQFMQAYYRHARNVTQIRERVMRRAEALTRTRQTAAVPVDEFLSTDSGLTLQDASALSQDPGLPLRLCASAVRHGCTVDPDARDSIARLAVDEDWARRMRDMPNVGPQFVELLAHAGDVSFRRGSILGELHDVGLMLAMIPEFAHVTGRVQHDIYHVYTVDVHTIAAIDRLREIFRGEWAAEAPTAARLAAESLDAVHSAYPLFVALLLHDIGKGRGGDHSKLGAEMCGPICTRLGLNDAETEHVVWLVREHLTLYHWATRRDVSDPDTVHEIAKSVGTVARLRDLYLLTVADLSTTNPKAMTAWKARLLEDLYVSVAGALQEGEALAVEVRGRNVRAAVTANVAGAMPEEFLRVVPERYLLATPVDAIAAHARLYEKWRVAKTEHELFLLPGSSEDLAELVLFSPDKPGLLAEVAAVLSANRLSVTAAQVHTIDVAGKGRTAFDVFHVRRAAVGADSALEPSQFLRLQTDLREVLGGRVSAELLLAERSLQPDWAKRREPGVRTEVHLDNGGSKAFTIVDVYTKDRPGLLYDLASTIHQEGFSIGLSKINTEGHRAVDVFYVADRDGAKVSTIERMAHLERALRERLGVGSQEAQSLFPGSGER